MIASENVHICIDKQFRPSLSRYKAIQTSCLETLCLLNNVLSVFYYERTKRNNLHVDIIKL